MHTSKNGIHMELKSGYKQTEVGVIPQDWECTVLDTAEDWSCCYAGGDSAESTRFPQLILRS